jgi:hypothetical protein
LNALCASKLKISENHLIGQSMFMRMYNLLLALLKIAESPRHSKERLIGFGMKMKDIGTWSGGNAI